MEEKNITPNYQNKAGGDDKLKAELEKALDREMDKSPDDIDVQKIDSIIDLLNQIDGVPDNSDHISKNEFAEKYLPECNISEPQKMPDKKPIPIRTWKVAAGFLSAVFVLCMGNYISVRATSKDIFTFVKDKAYVMYFDVFEKSNSEKAENDDSSAIQETLTPEDQQAASWEEAQKISGLGFKIPQFIPEGLEAQIIHIQITEEKDVGISRQYYNRDDNSNVRFLIRYISGNGKWMCAMDKMNNLIEQKEINDYMVSFYQTDDAIQAMYQDEQFIYVVETNMDQKTLEKIVEEMR
ncbi:uncharacterized protein DUF4367 [Kineothrix alysoides]|uniref:Uncharacterized protein DUF4367 n=1 Tax=Kineothrix alysoides TaxID=1469948 RepID=A0A4R1QNC5_9FIRM|nr:DUF4367 domain-containing protein [Kineothrix alysoides]TCL55226.1 uncharacterized protein DUF4367 [Kineothrix alysoides]